MMRKITTEEYVSMKKEGEMKENGGFSIMSSI
jgi:hypothetical protein